MPDPYDPQKHHRQSVRLKSYDYTQPGAYFVTLVAWRRQPIFGQIQAGEIRLSPAGEIVQQVWDDLPRHFNHITLGSAVVMPNHFHGIIFIEGRGEAAAGITCSSPSTLAAAASPSHGPKGTIAGSLGAIIQNFKSITSRMIARVLGRSASPVWQRNYYERVLRNEDELRQLSAYILNNPSCWDTDQENPHP
jgi:putative transposase